MKKPKEMKLVENKATYDLFKKIRELKEDTLYFVYIRDILIKEYQKYNIDNFDNQKYYREMIGHAEKNLKKENIISVEGTANNKIYKIENIKIPDPFGDIDSSNITWNTKQKISQIFEFVNSQKHLIPYFQRGTAWTKTNDYIELAYSIFRCVPLGIMYLWKIDKKKIIEIGHNKFKRDILSSEEASNFKKVNINEIKSQDVYSVIDGQQRITGINVMINGSFNGKKMFFNERQPGSKKFKFFKPGKRIFWNSVDEIYSSLLEIKNQEYLDEDSFSNVKSNLFSNLSEKLFISVESLESFYNGFFKAELVAICELPNIELPEILQVFIRTNQFGKKLNPTDIMMSYIVGQDSKTRKKIIDLHERTKKFKANIKLSTILKLVSVIFNDNATIRPLMFSEINQRLVERSCIGSRDWKIMDFKKQESWNRIYKAIDQLISITKQGKFDVKWIKSDNSIIPIIYWIIYWNNSKKVTNYKVINEINTYLLIVQLSKAFRSSTDQRLNYIINNLTNEFSGWQLNLERESTIETIKNEISVYKYKRNNSEIKILLMSIGTPFYESDSIEHIVAQNSGGSDFLYNLTLLPKEINSEIKDSSIKDKVNHLSKRYGLNESEIMRRLLLNKEEVDSNMTTWSRLERILELIAGHLK